MRATPRFVREEMQSAPNLPKLLLGDLNCDTSQIAELEDCLARGVLIDVGAHKAFTAVDQALRTCQAQGARSSTRRDYAFADKLALPWGVSATIRPGAAYDVHSPLKLILN